MRAVGTASALPAVSNLDRGSPALAPLVLTIELSSDQITQLATAVLALVRERVDAQIRAAERDKDDECWWSVAEVAARVGLSRRTVYRALASGALVGERVGSCWRIRPAAVTDWVR